MIQFSDYYIIIKDIINMDYYIIIKEIYNIYNFYLTQSQCWFDFLIII